MEPIAIVGISLKLPQGAEDEASFWDMLEKGRNTVSEWPESRANLEAFYHPETKELNTACTITHLKTKGAHFLREDPAVFDAPFFSITSKEAASMDPQQRWVLETTYRALENAGIPAENLAGTNTAVYSFAMAFDYFRMISKDPDDAPLNVSTGTGPSILANRISWFWDLKGPSIVLNTACSTSVIAVDIACQSLRSGQSSMAILAGSNFLLSAELSVHLCNMGFLAPDGVCHSFDERASGYGRGEGCIVLVLKRLSDAVRDGNMIRAVIRGSGTNQDGHTPGITQPSAEAQEALIKMVYANAGLGLESTRYVEAHGTGTQVGDATEVKSIGRVFKSSRSRQEPLYVGSIKANVGHLEAGSGLAGIAKCISVLERGIIPPVAMFEKLNPKINAKLYNLEIPKTCIPWPHAGLRRISLNSFGFGGSNAHMILDDAYHTLESLSLNGLYHRPSSAAALEEHLEPLNGHLNGYVNGHTNGDSNHLNGHANGNLNGYVNGTNGATNGNTNGTLNGHTNGHAEDDRQASSSPDYQLLMWTAKNEASLKRMLPQHVEYYGSKIVGSKELLKRLAFTLADRRSVMPWRSYAIADAQDKSEALNSALSAPVRASRDVRLAFIFTGQGAQYVGMGLGLLEYPVFASTLSKISQIFRELGADWTLLEEMRCAERINNARFSQPLCTALQIALIELLRSFNISPDAVVGHSSGEIAAAYTIGALSLESACKVAYHRGRLAALMSSSQPVKGAMMSVNLPELEVPAYLTKHSLESLTVACINSPSNVTISGPENDIESLKKILDEEKIFARTVKTGIAYHSPAMQQISAEYIDSIGTLEMGSSRNGQILMISSVTGHKVTPQILCNAQYWVDNLVSPVQFCDALQYIATAAPKIDGLAKISDYLEIGPAAALRRPADDSLSQVIGKKGFRYGAVLSKFEPPMKAVLGMAGRLFAFGYPLSISALNRQDLNKATVTPFLVDMPEYPFDHSLKYWHESRLSRDWRLRGAAPRSLLGMRATDWNPLQPSWRKLLSVEHDPWLADHMVGETILYPAAGTLMMSLEAVRQFFKDHTVTSFMVKEATFGKPIILRTEGKTEVTIELHPLQESYEKSPTRAEVRIFACLDNHWSECFRALIHPEFALDPDEVDKGRAFQSYMDTLRQDLLQAKTSCTKAVSKREFYKWFTDLGLKYGPAFALSDKFFYDGGDVGTAQIDVDQQFEGIVHPGVLDSALQVCALAPSKGMTCELPTMVPHKMVDTWVSASGWQRPQNKLIQVVARNKADGSASSYESGLVLYDENGSPLFHLKSFITSAVVGGESADESRSKLLHSIDWKPQLSLLVPEQLQRYCKADEYFEDETNEIVFSSQLESTLRAVLQHNLDQLVRSDWSLVPGHMRQYVDWAKSQLQQVPGRTKDVVSEEDLIAELENLRAKKPSCSLLVEVALHLVSIVRGEVDASEYIGSAQLTKNFWEEQLHHTFSHKLVTFLELTAHQNPAQRILEVGAGQGLLTSRVVEALEKIETRTGGNSFSHYVCTDTTTDRFEAAQEQFADQLDRLSFKPLDLDSEITNQGFEAGSFDLVFADNALRSSKNLSNTLESLQRVLKPGGHIILHEFTASDNFLMQFVFSLSSSWWDSEEKTRSSRPTITEPEWDTALRSAGFSGNDLVIRDFKADGAHKTSIIVSTASPNMVMPTNKSRNIFFVINSDDEYQSNIALATANGPFDSWGYQTKVLYLSQVTQATLSPSDCVIFLADLGKKALLHDISATNLSLILKWVQSSTSLIWVSSIDTSEGLHPLSEPFSGLKDGFTRTLRAEFTSKHIVSATLEGDARDINRTVQDISQIFLSAIESLSPEHEYVVREGQVLIPRMVEEINLNKDFNSSLRAELKSEPWLPGPPLSLEIARRGSLESLQFVEDMWYYEDLGPHDVEIEAKSWGVGFQDVAYALGKTDGGYLGSDCSGVVTRVGPECTSITVGDRVCMYTEGSMKAYSRAEEHRVIKLADHISFNDAAALLSPALAVLYSLIEVGRLEKGEKVLIHSASGATGQLAIQVAKMIGAEIFVTVGHEDKKRLLQETYGIPTDHIFYSRNNTFAKGIMCLTNNYGVDVVLNSLVGEDLRASWECLAPYGRFLEIGKEDIGANSSLPMGAFAGNKSFTSIDLRHVYRHRKETSKSLLTKAMKLVSYGAIYSPKPLSSFGLASIKEAFSHINGGRNAGRVVISIEPTAVVEKRIIHRRTWTFDANATYLVSGGLGGIGRSMLRWMVDRGARNLVVPSRSGAASGAALELVDDLTGRGVNIITPKCDVASQESLSQVLDDCEKTMPPIRGCINAAMVLNDSIFENMTHDQWERTVRSKVQTSWNLHTLLPRNLDFFILLSSVSGIIGNGGQANYATGCTFQDALARYRINQGQRALSIDVGAMKGIGVIAETDNLKKTFASATNLVLVEEKELLTFLEIACDPALEFPSPERSQVSMGIVTPRDLLSRGLDIVDMMERPMYAFFSQARGMSDNSSSNDTNFAALFRQSSSAVDRAQIVSEALAKKLSKALSMQAEDIDCDKPLHAYGVDSLVAVELRGWIGKEFAADVSVFEMMGGRSIFSIAELATEASQIGLEK
ncbi:unnamed protein product [Clonostachys solani]|uniref:Carrier domain-containing protein n=1 Tax=Clonostachys solani TaxID=160281 RepID=A0A9N9Z7T2_9HYPO|nr:unnamed protein product [Clonostachys solani]